MTMAMVRKRLGRFRKKKVPHMLYEHLRWITQSPPQHPTCSLSVAVSSKGYSDNKFKPPPMARRRESNMSVLADTGCQACCMGPSQIHALGLSQVDLIEPVLNLKAANSTGITILGATYLYIYGRDKTGRKWDTHQLVYVTEDLNQVLLSKEACQQLGMISPEFPAVGCHDGPYISDVSTLVGLEPLGPASAQQQGQGEHEPTGENSGLILPEADLNLTPSTPREDGTCECPAREPTPTPPIY